jgi:hypothetical protein
VSKIYIIKRKINGRWLYMQGYDSKAEAEKWLTIFREGALHDDPYMIDEAEYV